MGADMMDSLRRREIGFRWLLIIAHWALLQLQISERFKLTVFKIVVLDDDRVLMHFLKPL